MAISYEEFLRVDVRVGTVTAAESFSEAHKPAYKLTIDFGPEIGVKRSSAQVTAHYEASALIGRQVIGVVNFRAKQIGPFLSEVLVLGISDAEGRVVLMGPDKPVPNGNRLY